MTCAPREDSNQPGHPPSLISVFAVSLEISWVLSYSLIAQRRLWSDWAYAQAYPSLRRAHVILLVLSCACSFLIFSFYNKKMKHLMHISLRNKKKRDKFCVSQRLVFSVDSYWNSLMNLLFSPSRTRGRISERGGCFGQFEKKIHKILKFQVSPLFP